MVDGIATVDELMERLREAASGLLFPSETDVEVTPVRFRGAAEVETALADFVQSEGWPAGTLVETVSVDELFAPVMQVSEEDSASDAEKYRALLRLLKGELRDLTAVRVGEIDIGVYVLGRHASGEWVGVKTRVVET